MVERILKLMNDRKITAYKLAKDLKLSHNSLNAWKNKKAKPSVDYVIKIAEYFGVTTDYLLTGKEFNVNAIKQVKTEVQALFDSLDERPYKKIAIAHLKELNNQQEQAKKENKKIN